MTPAAPISTGTGTIRPVASVLRNEFGDILTSLTCVSRTLNAEHCELAVDVSENVVGARHENGLVVHGPEPARKVETCMPSWPLARSDSGQYKKGSPWLKRETKGFKFRDAACRRSRCESASDDNDVSCLICVKLNARLSPQIPWHGNELGSHRSPS